MKQALTALAMLPGADTINKRSQSCWQFKSVNYLKKHYFTSALRVFRKQDATYYKHALVGATRRDKPCSLELPVKTRQLVVKEHSMRILMLGAGGIGGYFGARIHEAGGDITFLVRPARANNLSAEGLHIISPLGDVRITPKLITSAQVSSEEKFDAVILSCKAYDLDAAVNAVTPALTPDGIIVPLLNGIAHLALLDEKFGRKRVLGGMAHLGVTMTSDGKIRHLNELHRLVIGSRDQHASPLVDGVAKVLGGSCIDFQLSKNIEREMWDKYVFLTVLASATCMMRASIGDILQTCGGEGFILGVLDECRIVAQKYGHTPSDERLAQYRSQLTARGSTSTASMLRDIEQNGRTEADHILGDMVHRATSHGIEVPFLKMAYSNLQAYELRRNRTLV